MGKGAWHVSEAVEEDAMLEGKSKGTSYDSVVHE
jgi:hypothetical protein